MSGGTIIINAIQSKEDYPFSYFQTEHLVHLCELGVDVWQMKVEFQPKLVAGGGTGVEDLRHDSRPAEREEDEG